MVTQHVHRACAITVKRDLHQLGVARDRQGGAQERLGLFRMAGRAIGVDGTGVEQKRLMMPLRLLGNLRVKGLQPA